MNKLLVALLVAFAIFTVLDGIAAGNLGVAATHLTVAAAEDDTTLTVVSTKGFLIGGYVVVEGERIDYTSTTSTMFTGLTRGGGWKGEPTVAATHPVGARVYNESAGAMNAVLGYSVISSVNVFGMFSIPVPNPKLFTVTIPKALLWDYSFLEGDLVILKYVLFYPVSAGFLIAMLIVFIQVIRGLFSIGV